MKIDTKTAHFVDYNDFDAAISEFLKEKGAKKCQFEIVAVEGLSNDSSPTFSVGKHKFAIPDDDDKAEILNGNLDYKTYKILEWMHAEGKIPSGEYVVGIFW